MAVVPRMTEEDLKNFEPLHDYVVIKKWKAPEKTQEGVIVPEDGNDYQSKRGTVVKMGSCENLRRIKAPLPNFKVGDDVLFSAFAGMEIPMPPGYIIMRAHEIMVVLVN